MTEQQAVAPAYHQLYRKKPDGWWLPGLAAVPIALLVTFIGLAVVQAGFTLGFVLAGEPVKAGFERIQDFDDPTPLGLAYLNLTLASVIPLVFAVVKLLHDINPGWLTSVAPRMRWRWFLTCLGLACVALLATVVVGTFLPTTGGAEPSTQVNDFTSTTRDFLLVVLFLTPFQAAGEEYIFRGYLTQAFGSIFPASFDLRWVSRTIAVVVPAVLFALAHGLGQEAPVFFDRLAFGLVAGVLVIGTGGLEAAIAMHVLNNFLAFGFALAFADMASAFNPTEVSWWMIPTTLTQSLVYLGLALTVAKSRGIATVATRAVRPVRAPR